MSAGTRSPSGSADPSASHKDATDESLETVSRTTSRFRPVGPGRAAFAVRIPPSSYNRNVSQYRQPICKAAEDPVMLNPYGAQIIPAALRPQNTLIADDRQALILWRKNTGGQASYYAGDIAN